MVLIINTPPFLFRKPGAFYSNFHIHNLRRRNFKTKNYSKKAYNLGNKANLSK